MKAIILAGGYAKRLWPLTKDTPKPLLDVGGKAIIDRIIEKLNDIEDVNDIVISTNAKFKDIFENFMKTRDSKKPMKLVVEPTMKEGEKLGSIGGLNYLIDHLEIDEDVLLIGGDNIFEFDMGKFLDYYKDNDGSVVALKKIEDNKLIKKYGVCKLNDEQRIVELWEKSDNPVSDLASTACYIFTFNDLMLVKEYLKEDNPSDAMGFFISWLIDHTEVYGFVFNEEWYDIGSFEQLEEARKRYEV